MQAALYRYLGADAVGLAPHPHEIACFFTPDGALSELLATRRDPVLSLGLILQAGFLRMTGRFPPALDRVSPAMLAFAAECIGVTAPQIATLRAIYRRRQTLFEHRTLVATALGFREVSEHCLRGLTAHLRKQAAIRTSRHELIADSCRWLYDRGYILPGRRVLADHASAAESFYLRDLLARFRQSAGSGEVDGWLDALSGPVVGDQTLFEWLNQPITGYGARDIAEVGQRIARLRALGADRLGAARLSLDQLRYHGKRAARRQLASLKRLRDPRRTVELGCWLRLQLLDLTDAALDQFSRRVGQLWGDARRHVEESAFSALQRHRHGALSVMALLDRPDLGIAELKAAITAELGPLVSADLPRSRMQAVRQQMTAAPMPLRRLLGEVAHLKLRFADNPSLAEAFAVLNHAREQGAGILSQLGVLPFPPAAARLVAAAQDDAGRLAAWEVATAILLRRALRNGSVHTPDSVRHRSIADQLIPRQDWEARRRATSARMGWAPNLMAQIRQLEPALEQGLVALDAAVANGEIALHGDRLVFPRLRAAPVDPAVDQSRRALFDAVGQAQLPEVIIAVDRMTNFSATLVDGRGTRLLDREAIYAALIAHGTEKTAADMARMVEGISVDRIEQTMRRIEDHAGLRAANNAVVSHMLTHPVARYWGSGVTGSADMMSLDATRHLWLARTEPRRGTPAVGTYTHVLDQWAIAYDQPVLLNVRQAGAAIAGLLHQRVAELQRLAVDTHGYTHFAMACAKLLGFDLTPRLKGMSGLKLYVPNGLPVPPRLASVVHRIPIARQAQAGWDGLLHLVASLEAGHASAAELIGRHGSAAQGLPVHECGTLLGKLLRSLFMLDYLAKPDFRRELHRTLTQGEAVHRVQRALMAGHIGPRQGRTLDRLSTISGALTLLTNIVMTWNTVRMQFVLDHGEAGSVPPEHLAHIAPIAFAHINMQGVMRFDVAYENAGHHRRSGHGKRPA